MTCGGAAGAGLTTARVVATLRADGFRNVQVVKSVSRVRWATADLRLTLERWAQHLNTLLYRRLEGNKYVTAFLLLLEADGIHGRYVNAGHPSGLVAGAGGGDGNGKIRRLDSTGPPLGLLPDQTYSAGDFTLDAGDVALLYSDGLSEATDAAGRELGSEGLESLLRANRESISFEMDSSRSLPTHIQSSRERPASLPLSTMWILTARRSPLPARGQETREYFS